MKSAFFGVIMVALLVGGCANSEQSVFLDSFIPPLPESDCMITPDSAIYYDTGVIDIYFSADYTLGFRITNQMGTSAAAGQGAEGAPIESQEANLWKMKYIILSYELPGVPALDRAVWGRREIPAQVLVDNDGGQVTKTVDVLTAAQHNNLLQIFSAFSSLGVSFDWETYPILVTVQAEGEKQGGGDIVRTNELQFKLVPVYGEMLMSGSVYPDKGWDTDDEIKTKSGGDAVIEAQLKYERDADIYETIMNSCVFPNEHLVGCYPGQNFGLVDCYTFAGADQLVEALLPGSNCCPMEAPDEPQAPTSGE